MNILYIILKHVIWRFQTYNLSREIFKFREDKSNNVFREIRKCFRKTAKFEFFVKQIIYLESPDHPLQNDIYTILQNKRMRRCGVAPPPIIFERLKLPQQIIYRRKENLSESPNHQKYWENILVSRFYEQFSRNRRNLGHFRKFEKISNS